MSVTKTFFYACIAIANLHGLVLVGFGVYLYVHFVNGYEDYVASILYIASGIVPLAINLLICILNRCCQILYSVFICICIGLQVVMGYFLIIHRKTNASNLANLVDVAWENEVNDPGYMTVYEETFECCGRTSPQDYVLIERTPPATCFKDLVQLPQNLISDGCRILVEDYFNLLLFISNVILCLGVCVEILTICSYRCVCAEERVRWRQHY